MESGRSSRWHSAAGRHHEGHRGPILGDDAIEAIIAEGDLVAVRWRAETELAAGAEFFGIAGSGQSVTLSGMSMYQIACGEIAATWRIIDLVGVLTQLGWPDATATPEA